MFPWECHSDKQRIFYVGWADIPRNREDAIRPTSTCSAGNHSQVQEHSTEKEEQYKMQCVFVVSHAC